MRRSRGTHSIGVTLCFILFAALMFFAAGTIVFQFTNEHFKKQNIIKNGNPIIGNVVEYHPGAVVNNEQKYYVVYEYELNGKKSKGRTGDYYDQLTAENMVTIELYEYNGEVCELEAFDNKQVYIAFIAIVPAGFGVFFIIMVFKSFKTAADKTGRGFKNGKLANAVVVSKYSNLRVNRVSQYKIVCQFTKDNGEVVKGEAQGYFDPVEARYLETKKDIKVSYLDKKFMIAEDLSDIDYEINNGEVEVTLDTDYPLSQQPTQSSYNAQPTAAQYQPAQISHYQCEKCGNVVKPNSNSRCPLCGELIDLHLLNVGMKEKRVPCPKCKNMVLEHAKFCNFCGSSMNSAEADIGATISCPTCGKQVSSEAKFCTGCGNKLK